MPPYKILDQKGLYFLTLTVIGWVDIFSRPIYREILIDSLKYCIKAKGLRVFAYVIMSNHIHLIACVREESGQTLSEVLRDFKKFSANRILEQIQIGPESRKDWMLHVFRYYARFNTNNRFYQIWKQDNHPIELFSPKVIWEKVHYIHLNPVRSKLVEQATDYLYSSARNYLELPGILEVELIEPVVFS